MQMRGAMFEQMRPFFCLGGIQQHTQMEAPPHYVHYVRTSVSNSELVSIISILHIRLATPSHRCLCLCDQLWLLWLPWRCLSPTPTTPTSISFSRHGLQWAWRIAASHVAHLFRPQNTKQYRQSGPLDSDVHLFVWSISSKPVQNLSKSRIFLPFFLIKNQLKGCATPVHSWTMVSSWHNMNAWKKTM